MVWMASESGVLRQFHGHRRVPSEYCAGACISVLQSHAANTFMQCERDQGPFDAILAFSMGAVFAQILCAARACHLPPSVQSSSEEVGAYILPSLKFAVRAFVWWLSTVVNKKQVFVACRPHKDERFQLGARAVPSFHMCELRLLLQRKCRMWGTCAGLRLTGSTDLATPTQ